MASAPQEIPDRSLVGRVTVYLRAINHKKVDVPVFVKIDEANQNSIQMRENNG